MPPIIKSRGHYVMAYASVSVNILSIIGQTPGSIDPIFLWLIGGDYAERLLSMISSAAHPRWPLRLPSWILVSVDYRTNAWVNWSNFSVAHWGWLEEGFFRWSALLLIQDGRYGRHLGFGFRRLDDKRLGRLIQFLCGSLGMTRGRFLSMISSAAHPSCPSSWFGFCRSDYKCLGRLIRFFCGLLGMTRGRFLSMISSAAHPRWSWGWIWFRSIFWL
jgi:hypothetical protein